MEFKYFTKFTASESIPEGIKDSSRKDELNKFLLKGILVDTSTNKNGWCVEEEDFKHLAEDFIGRQIRTDHAEKVSNVIGKVISTEIDGPHKEAKNEWDPSTEYSHIHFIAEAVSKDENITIPIKLGYVTHVSPAVDSLKILCSSCRAPMKYNGYSHVKTCQCEGGTKLLKELTGRELSLVVSPAYQGTVVRPYGFAASVDSSFLSEEQVLEIVRDELTKRG